jgi:hypothetical protein
MSMCCPDKKRDQSDSVYDSVYDLLTMMSSKVIYDQFFWKCVHTSVIGVGRIIGFLIPLDVNRT